jgi:hypothetical protein
MNDEEKIALARAMFDAWSYRGGGEAIVKVAHPEMELLDLHIGLLKGHEQLVPAVTNAIKMWPDMDYELERFWVNESGVAVNWVMKATVTPALAEKYGAENVGREWRSPGMSYLDMKDGLVVKEFDHYDPGGVRRSLGLHKRR